MTLRNCITITAMTLATLGLASCGCDDPETQPVASGVFTSAPDWASSAPFDLDMDPAVPMSLTVDAEEGTAVLRYQDTSGQPIELALEVGAVGTYP